MLLIKNGMVHTGIDPEPFQADVLIDNGRILEIGKDIPCDGKEIWDAAGMELYPGFIDAHTHIGMFGFSDSSKDDVESFDRCTPNHRGIDAINPQEPSFRQALEAGVTCVCVGPGSVGCLSGTHLAVKTYGIRIDDMVVKNPVAMKAALGANPKMSKDKVTTRMTIAAVIRETLIRAKEYARRVEKACGDPDKMPAYDPKLEALIPVVQKKIPLKVHAHRADDVFTAIRIAKECDVDLTLEHVADGALIADALAKEGYPVAVGPHISQSKKEENANKSPAAAVAMIRAGCQVSIMTDAPVMAEEYLPVAAGLLMREGLSQFEALQTITINPARHLGIADRVGSLDVGKDADIIVASGCPLQMSVKPEAVFVNGQLVYSRG